MLYDGAVLYEVYPELSSLSRPECREYQLLVHPVDVLALRLLGQSCEVLIECRSALYSGELYEHIEHRDEGPQLEFIELHQHIREKPALQVFVPVFSYVSEFIRAESLIFLRVTDQYV